jgi:hypothetical protein
LARFVLSYAKRPPSYQSKHHCLLVYSANLFYLCDRIVLLFLPEVKIPLLNQKSYRKKKLSKEKYCLTI